jgi:hypothetical protein
MSGWRDSAACRSIPGDVWFPEKRGGDRELRVARAVKICSECPERVPCARYALSTSRSIGVWAGVDLGDNPSLARPTEECAEQLRAVLEEADQ